MKLLNFHAGLTSLLFSLVFLLFSCTKDTDEVSPETPSVWSEAAPHQPTAIDLYDKISGFRLEGGWMPIPQANPVFEGFDDPVLLERITQELNEGNVPSDRIATLLTYLEDSDFQYKVNNNPNTARLLLTTVTHSNEVMKQVSEALFEMLSQNVNRLILTDEFPAGAGGGSSVTTLDRRVYSRGSIFNGSKGEDMRADWFNEATEISYLVAGITPPSQNAQILQTVLQSLLVMHDYGSFLDEQHSGSIANAGIRDNLAWLFLTLYRPKSDQEAQLQRRYYRHPNAIVPTDNPATPNFNESNVNTMSELVERSRQTLYADLPNLPDQAVPNWLAQQYEVLAGAPMPNGPVADQAAIELAIQACNTFLDSRPEARAFVKAYYGVEFP